MSGAHTYTETCNYYSKWITQSIFYHNQIQYGIQKYVINVSFEQHTLVHVAQPRTVLSISAQVKSGTREVLCVFHNGTQRLKVHKSLAQTLTGDLLRFLTERPLVCRAPPGHTSQANKTPLGQENTGVSGYRLFPGSELGWAGVFGFQINVFILTRSSFFNLALGKAPQYILITQFLIFQSAEQLTQIILLWPMI